MASERPRRMLRALAGLAVCLAAPWAWAGTLDSAFLRATGLAMWIGFALGLALTVSAVRADRRWRVRTVLALELLLVAAMAWGQFGLARLPAATNEAALERAPDFALADVDGHVVRLSEELARGPVLLVFFRGTW